MHLESGGQPLLAVVWKFGTRVPQPGTGLLGKPFHVLRDALESLYPPWTWSRGLSLGLRSEVPESVTKLTLFGDIGGETRLPPSLRQYPFSGQSSVQRGYGVEIEEKTDGRHRAVAICGDEAPSQAGDGCRFGDGFESLSSPESRGQFSYIRRRQMGIRHESSAKLTLCF